MTKIAVPDYSKLHFQQIILLDKVAEELKGLNSGMKELNSNMEKITMLLASVVYRDEADIDAQSRIRVIGDDLDSYGGTI